MLEYLVAENDSSAEGRTWKRTSRGSSLHPADPPTTRQPEQPPATVPGNSSEWHSQEHAELSCFQKRGTCATHAANAAVYFNGLLYDFAERMPAPAMLRPACLRTHQVFQITSKFKHFVEPFTSFTSCAFRKGPTHFTRRLSAVAPSCPVQNGRADLSSHRAFWLAIKECWHAHHRCWVIKAVGGDWSHASCDIYGDRLPQVMTHNSLVHCWSCQGGIRRSEPRGALTSEKCRPQQMMRSEIWTIKGR